MLHCFASSMRAASRVQLLAVVCLFGAVAACAENHTAEDTDAGGGDAHDSGIIHRDAAGYVAVDGGGVVGTDSGTTPMERDAGVPPRRDAGARPDAGPPIPPGDGGPGGPGTPCEMPSECVGDGAMCLTRYAMIISFPGGYCTKSCMTNDDCGPGAGCLSLSLGGLPGGGGIPGGGGMMAFCGRACSSNADCREGEGYQCRNLPIGPSAQMYCLPPIGFTP